MNGLFKFIIIAGPNGAGQTTFAKNLFPTVKGLFVYLNADEIARKQGLTAIGAGREMLRLVDHNLEQRNDIMLETTLAGQNYLLRIPEWRQRGYTIVLYYLRLPNVEASLRRVRRRVAAGGHDIPEAVITKRFQRSLDKLEIVKNLVDDWYVYDSLDGQFRHAESWISS